MHSSTFHFAGSIRRCARSASSFTSRNSCWLCLSQLLLHWASWWGHWWLTGATALPSQACPSTHDPSPSLEDCCPCSACWRFASSRPFGRSSGVISLAGVEAFGSRICLRIRWVGPAVHLHYVWLAMHISVDQRTHLQRGRNLSDFPVQVGLWHDPSEWGALELHWALPNFVAEKFWRLR